MKCWNEIANNAMVYFGWGNQLSNDKNIGISVDLSVISINASMIFSQNDRKDFQKVCTKILKETLYNEELLKDYKLYLFANIELEKPVTKIAMYKKVWKTLKNIYVLDNFNLGPEIEENINDKIYFTSIAQFGLDNFQTALEIISSNSQRYMIFGSKRQNILTEQYTRSLFNIALSKYVGHNEEINYFDVSSNLCSQGDIVFRWGDSSEEAEIAIIATPKIIKYFYNLI